MLSGIKVQLKASKRSVSTLLLFCCEGVMNISHQESELILLIIAVAHPQYDVWQKLLCLL